MLSEAKHSLRTKIASVPQVARLFAEFILSASEGLRVTFARKFGGG